MRFGGEKDVEHQMLDDVSLATFEPMPFSAIGAKLTKVERLAGTDSARFTFQVDSSDLQWPVDPVSGQREANILISGAALGSIYNKKTLAFKGRTWNLSAPATLPESKIKSSVSITLDVPRKTKQLRFVVRDIANGRMGSIDLNPKAVAAAPMVDATAPPAAAPVPAPPPPAGVTP